MKKVSRRTNDCGAVLAVAVEEFVTMAVKIEGGITESLDGDARFDADAVLIGGKRELDGALAAGQQIVAGNGPGSLKAAIGGRSGEQWMGAAEASPARGEDEGLVRAIGVGGVRIETADEALGVGEDRNGFHRSHGGWSNPL